MGLTYGPYSTCVIFFRCKIKRTESPVSAGNGIKSSDNGWFVSLLHSLQSPVDYSSSAAAGSSSDSSYSNTSGILTHAVLNRRCSNAFRRRTSGRRQASGDLQSIPWVPRIRNFASPNLWWIQGNPFDHSPYRLV